MPPVVTISWRRSRRGCQAAVRRGNGSRTVIVGSREGPGRWTRARSRDGVRSETGGRVGDLAQPTRGATRRRLAARTTITVAEGCGGVAGDTPPRTGGAGTP